MSKKNPRNRRDSRPLMKGARAQPTANMLHGETLKTFPLDQEKGRHTFVLTLFKEAVRILARASRQPD